MTRVHAPIRDTKTDIAIARTKEDLNVILQTGCPAVIWHRHPLASFQTWIDGLDPEQLPSVRVILPPQEVRDAVTTACDIAKMPQCVARTQLVDDIAALADIFADVMKAPFVRLRLDRITTNACRKFHTDAITARLICTYRGAGTQYGFSTKGTEPEHVLSAPKGAPMLLRGTLWPEQPTCGLLHRSPPIEGTGETRMVLVLDPVFDPENET